jgi:DNA adenine methylase
METLLKWPGGKNREFEQVKAYIPPFQTYIEPFFGGGAFFFNLSPKHSLLNDVNGKLVGLYHYVKQSDPTFEETISNYVRWWENLQTLIDQIQPSVHALYEEMRGAAFVKREMDERVAECLAEYEKDFVYDFTHFFGDTKSLWLTIEASLKSKMTRLPKLEKDNDVRFGEVLMRDHIATAVRAGFYTYLRDKFEPRTDIEEVANFYFLREFCYGSMFRFNKEGKFNIPYGGIGYNGKDFRGKASRLFSNRTRSLFAGSQLFNLDFRQFFDLNRPLITSDAFCFLDPPYDTEFSAYDNFAFTLKDQLALAQIFAVLPCHAMLIIKDTEYIQGIYRDAQKTNPRIQIARYDKTYTYNNRGRNERDTQHLIICNYPITAATLLPEFDLLELV